MFEIVDPNVICVSDSNFISFMKVFDVEGLLSEVLVGGVDVTTVIHDPNLVKAIGVIAEEN